MTSPGPHARALGGFGLAAFLFFASSSAFEGRSFRPSEEFRTLAQFLVFSTVARGGLVAVCSGAAFAFGLAVFGSGRRRLPAPFRLGFLAGLLSAILAALGLVGHLGRSVPLPFPVAAALPGLVAALAVLPLAYLCAHGPAARWRP